MPPLWEVKEESKVPPLWEVEEKSNLVPRPASWLLEAARPTGECEAYGGQAATGAGQKNPEKSVKEN